MNVVWVISDTLRRDHVGCYGNPDIRTPSLDAFAEKSVRFDRHYIASFPTMPTRADYYTGQWTGCFFPGFAPLTQDMVVLPEILSQSRLHTAAVVDTPMYLRGNYNYDRGFLSFFNIPGQSFPSFHESQDIRAAWRSESDRFAPRTFTKAMQWLERHYKEDFFLWIDAWDPHEPWDPPDYYTELYWPKEFGEVSMPANIKAYTDEGVLQPISEENLRKARAFYCGEVTMVDTWFGQLLRRLENMDLMKDTMVIFTSDHGTYQGDHGGRLGKHTSATSPDGSVRYGYCPLYEPIAATPLLIYIPGISPGSYSGLTSAIDMAPTVLDALGLEIPSSMEGESLLPAMKDPSVAGRKHVISGAPFRTDGKPLRRVGDHLLYYGEDSCHVVTTDEWSLLYCVVPGVSELFHLATDPNQEKNVINEHPEVARELHQLLVKFMADHKVDPKLREARSELRL